MSNSLVPPLLPEQPDFQYIWKQSESYEPKKEKKIQSLSAAMDVDEDIVRQNLPDYEALFASQQLYNDTVARSYPTFYRNLSNTSFVAAARDDMGNLIETEGWWNEIANAYNVARDTVAIGSMGTRAMLDGRDLYPYERRKIERARQLQRAHMQSEPGWFAVGAELLGTMQETLGYSLAAGYTAGAVSGPAAPVVAPIAAGIAGFATSFNLEAGNLYADLVVDGYTPAQAANIAATYGSAIAAFSAVGLKFAGTPFKELAREVVKKRGSELLASKTATAVTGRVLGQYGLGVVVESGSEGVEEVLSEAGKARASQLYRPDNLYEPEYLETFGQAAWHTFKGMTVLGGIPTSGRLITQNIRAAQSLHDERQAVRAAENYAKSRAPEAAEQVSREAGETLPDDKYYLRAQGFMETVRDIERQEREQGKPEGEFRRTLEEYQPGLLEKLEEAAARDGDVELSKTDFDKVFSRTEAFKAAFQHVAHREDGMTVREREEFMGIREKMTKDMEEEQKAELQKMEEVEDELVEIRQAVRAAVEPVIGEEAAKGMDVAANMTVLTSFITRAAAVQGISPKEFVERYMPQIVQQRLTGQQAQQQTEQQAKPKKERPRRAPKPTDPMGEESNQAFPQHMASISGIKSEMKRTFILGLMNELGRDNNAELDADRINQISKRMTAEGQPFDLPVGDMLNKVAARRRAQAAAGQEISDSFNLDVLEAQMDDILDPLPMEEEQTEQTEQQQAEVNNDDLKEMTKSQLREEAKKHPNVKRNGKGVTVQSLREGIAEARAAEAQAQQQPRPETLESGTFDQDADYTFTEGDYRPEVVAWAKEQFGDRVAPNGKPVYQNFVRWFGDSKVVDEDGKPLRVFHGTTAEFDSPQGLFWVSTATGLADVYSSVQSVEGSKIYPVYAQIRQPFDADNMPKEVSAGLFANTALEQARQEGREVDLEKSRELLKVIKDEMQSTGSVPVFGFWWEGFGNFSDKGRSAVVELLQVLGFDGIKYSQEKVGGGSTLTYASLDPDQIKSTQNLGDFSADPRILYSKEGPAPRKKMKVDTLLRLATGKQIENVKEAYELLGKGMRPGGKFGPEFSQGVRSLLSGQIAFDEVYSDALAGAPNEALKIAFERQGLDPNLVDLDAAMFDPSTEGPRVSTIEAVQEQLSQEFNEYETAKFLFNVAKTLDELAPTESGYSRVNQVLDSIARVFGEGYDTALEGDTVLLYSKEGEQRRVLGQAEVDGGNAIKKILLDPDAKPTTLMHELMHWNLELMSDMSLNIEQKEEAQRNALEKQVLKDTTALLEWAGYKGTLEGWRQMDLDARRPFHEAIAASFELFLYKGEAPSRQLRGIFQRLLNYINESYKQIVARFQKEYQDEFKRPLPVLNNDVRAIFGRMMSAERDTMDFFDQYDMTARLVTRKQWEEAGRDPKDYDEYDRDFKDAIAEAQAELTQRRMEEIGWQGRARERTGGKIREERRRTEAKAREDIDADVRETPIFQLQSYIYNGYYRAVDNPKVEPAKAESTRLSYEAVAAIDEEMAKKLARRGLLKKEGGIPLDVARNMFGFESNEQMLQQLSESRSITDEVEYRLDRYMIEEQSGLTDPVLVEERIQAAIHNRMRERVIGLELRYILNNGKNTKEELANAREMARDIIARTPTGDINLTAYNRAAARARKKALKALKDGDMEAAAFAKRQELLNEALIREGGKAREEVRKLVNANKRVFRHRSDKALAKAGYDVVIVKGLRALLSNLGIGGAFEGDPAAAMDAFMRYDPNFAEEFDSEIQHFLNLDLPESRVGDRRKQMERLTLSDAKRLRTLINQWLKRSKDVRTATLGEKKALVEEHQSELLDQIVKIPAKPRAVGEKESIFGNIRDYFSDLIRFEHLFRRIDGGKDGPWTRVFRMVKDAGNTYRREFLTFMSDMETALKKLDLKMPGGERTISIRLGRTDVILGSRNPGAKTDLMHMAMHFYGNASNRERLVAGYAGPNADEATLARTEAEIRTFLQEQIDKGVLTKSDFEWMQGIFDRLSSDDMFGRAQAVMKEVRGYEMTAIQPTPFTITFPGATEATEFKGGYIPIKFEDGSPDALPELEEGELSPEQQNKRMLSILPSFTKDRSNIPAPKPLRLGLQGIAHHAGEVYRYIHMTEPSMHIYRVLNGLDGNSPVRQAFIDRFGQRVYQNMLGWLKRSAYQAFERDSSQVSGLLYTLARNANMGIMFLNVGNALQNYTGLVMPMRQLGSRRVLSALTRTFVGKGIREEIAAKSPEMKARLERQIYDIMQGQRKLMTSEDSVWATAKGWINKNAYILQQITQNQVDVAVWQAAYNKETEVALRQDVSEAEAEKRAIAYADSVVRQTQMAGEKEDLSMFESQGGLFKAFFPFKSWFINWMNSAYAQGRIDASQADRNKITELATTYFYMLLIPALLAQAATNLAAGEDWDDEDDGYSDDLTEFFLVTQLNQAVGGIPVASDTWKFIANNWIDDSYWNSRFPVAPWQSALERLNRSAERALERPGRGTLNFVSELGTIMGVPTSRIFSRATLIGDEIYGELESESTYDFLRGAVTGQRSDLQRLSQ